MKKILQIQNAIKEFLSEVTPGEWVRIAVGLILIVMALCTLIFGFHEISNQPTNMYVYVDLDTGVNYIKIGNAEWMPRYDSDGNIMVTITTEETE